MGRMLPYTTYLIDLDGVIYRGNELLPGAREFVAWLESQHKKYLYLTNNSFATAAQVMAKLSRLGIAADQPHLTEACAQPHVFFGVAVTRRSRWPALRFRRTPPSRSHSARKGHWPA